MVNQRIVASSGNVVLELALGVMMFGVVLLPAAVALSDVVASRRWADEIAAAATRAWAVSDVGDRLGAAKAAVNALREESGLPVTFHYKCDQDCNNPSATITVTIDVGTASVGFLNVSGTSTTQRDLYAP